MKFLKNTNKKFLGLLIVIISFLKTYTVVFIRDYELFKCIDEYFYEFFCNENWNYCLIKKMTTDKNHASELLNQKIRL